MTEQEITQYLVKKYQPHAVLLHGSRTAGVKVTPETDWDMLVICTKPDSIKPEMLGELRLDVSGIAPTEDTCLAGGTPILPMRVLYDDALGLGRRVVENNQALFDKGPAPLTEVELTNRRNHLDRLVWRLHKRQHDPISSLVYKGDIAERACRYWCELQQIWSQALYRLTPLIEEKEPSFSALLKDLNGPEAPLAAKAIFQRLFGNHQS